MSNIQRPAIRCDHLIPVDMPCVTCEQLSEFAIQDEQRDILEEHELRQELQCDWELGHENEVEAYGK